jgi:uncharacterized protein (TIGR02246 family)
MWHGRHDRTIRLRMMSPAYRIDKRSAFHRLPAGCDHGPVAVLGRRFERDGRDKVMMGITPHRLAALLSGMVIALLLGSGMPAARADEKADVMALYTQFYQAQNAFDLDRVRALLADGPDFLWVTDGMAVWGRDALVQRMRAFQQAELWRVEPMLEQARPVVLDPDTAYLYLPLTLHYGRKSAPESLRFLVSVLCVRTEGGWRIAALFTTTQHA